MRTGRPRSFCKEEALDRAMAVFWRQGYEGASLSDLTAAMGINSPSLYACFGSKEGLFKAVVDRYEARRDSFMSAVLAAPTAQDVASTFLYGIADFAADTGGHNPPGCLMIQGALSCCEQQISKDMARRRAEKEGILKARFEQARKSGDLPKTANPAALARYLTAMANGISVQAASGANVKELREVASLALAGWPGANPKSEGKKARTRETA